MSAAYSLVDGPYGVAVYESCAAVQSWWVYVAASAGFAVVAVAVAALLAFWEWAHAATAATTRAAGRSSQAGCAWETRVGLERVCEELKAGAGPLGWLFNLALVLFTLGNWVLFIMSNIEVTYDAGAVDLHTPCGRSWFIIGNFVVNVGFFFFFLVRFVAARRKLNYCVYLTTLADFWLIPSAFVAFASAADWTGLRFICMLRLLYLPDALLYMGTLLLLDITSTVYCMLSLRSPRLLECVRSGVLRNYASIRFVQIAVNVGTIFMHDAGWMELFEDIGDFWNPSYVAPCATKTAWPTGCGPLNAKRTYIDYLFFIIPATFTGFGSLSPTPISTFGKFFIAAHLVCTFWYSRFFLPFLLLPLPLLIICSFSLTIECSRTHTYSYSHRTLRCRYMATALIEIFQYFSAPSVKYSSNVQRGRRDRYVILSGELSYRNIRTFYKAR